MKVGDLGVAKVLGTNTGFAKTCVGTPYYLSPELCEDKPYNDVSIMQRRSSVDRFTDQSRVPMHFP